MAITKIDPTQFEQASSVVIDSDATTNELAMREIENWAHAHGFVRTTEYWLRAISLGGKRHFRGLCYRLTEEDREAADEYLREVRESAERLAPRRTA